MKVSFKTTKWKEMVFTNGKQGKHTKVSSKKVFMRKEK